MNFTTFIGKGGKCRAARIEPRHTLYMQEEGHLLWSIGMVEFRALTRPEAGDWVVYLAGETAFVMTDRKFQEMYGGPHE